MGNEKDILQKALESYDDVFADIVNGLIFGGRQVVQETSLEQTRLRSFYDGEEGVREQERDAGKYWNNVGFHLALLGFENQSDIDPDIPLRIVGYDGSAYRDQLYYEKGEDGKRRRNRNPRYPVVTMVLYFGTKERWKKPLTLHEVLGEMPDELKPYVNDFKVPVFEIAWLTEEEVARFTSDFRILADYFVQVRKTGDYVPPNIVVIHMEELLRLMAKLTKDERFEKAYIEYGKGKEKPKTMCEVLDRVENRGMQKGMQKGIQKGRILEYIDIKREDGVAEEKVKENIMIRFRLSSEQAEKYMYGKMDAAGN